ncbi:MAG TPA: hypothetical protein VFB62_04715, partial [Polyangiaceae bacterium]|nr:hypothetical protein [Polyangiaceae bacterium]
MRAPVVTLWLILSSGCTLRGTDYLQSGIGCVPPLADCDGDGSCETNLADTAAHCGACGYACDGISCKDGSCLLDT